MWWWFHGGLRKRCLDVEIVFGDYIRISGFLDYPLDIPLFNLFFCFGYGPFPLWSHLHIFVDKFFVSFYLVRWFLGALERFQQFLHVVGGFVFLTLATKTAANSQANWTCVRNIPYFRILLTLFGCQRFVLWEAWVTKSILASGAISQSLQRDALSHALNQQFRGLGAAQTNVFFVFCYLSFALMALEPREGFWLA